MKRTDEMIITRLSVLFAIFALTLTACALTRPAGVLLRSGIPTIASNPIPITGPGAARTATQTTAPRSTPTSHPSPSPTATMAPTQPPVSRGPAVMLGSQSGPGSFLVDSRGMTLYIFTGDTVGVSHCGADCASAWPPLTIQVGLTPAGGPGVTGRLGVFKRSDGALQVTYNGWPLYYFSGDTKPGDTNGQGIGGLWFVAPQAGVQPAQPTLPPVYPTVVPGGGY